MATTFELQVAMDLQQPIIIVVRSCLVKRYAGMKFSENTNNQKIPH
jgi:hypothetical protein